MISKASATHKKKHKDFATPAATLVAQLHKKKEDQMEVGGDEHVDYLLDAMEYLKNDVRMEELDTYIQLHDPGRLPKGMKNSGTTIDDPGTCACGGQIKLMWDNSNEACVVCGVSSRVPLLHLMANMPLYDSKRQQQTMTKTSVHFYRRDGHMKTLLLVVSGSSNSQIPESVFSVVTSTIQKKDCIDPTIVGNILKKNKLNKYYQQRFRIAEITSNYAYQCHAIPPPYRLKLLSLFKRVSKAYDKFASQCKEPRKNFLSYPFVFAKLNSMLGHPEYSDHVPLLKSKERLAEQHRIWEALNIKIQER